MDIQDHKSFTVLTYVSQIKSSIKDELLHIILERQTQSGEINFNLISNLNSTLLIPVNRP